MSRLSRLRSDWGPLFLFVALVFGTPVVGALWLWLGVTVYQALP